jgi:hypothetical protein
MRELVIRGAFCALALSVSSFAFGKDSIPITAGEYETISKPGNHRNSICFRNPTVDAKVLEAMMNYAGGGSMKCSVTPRSAKGTELVVRLNCTYGDGSNGKGEMVMNVQPAGFTSTSKFKISKDDDNAKNITTKTTGTRVGNCG